MKTLTGALVGFACAVSAAWAAEADRMEAVMEALKPFQTLVGNWEGSGSSDSSKGWDEEFRCAWKFSKSGRVSLYIRFDKTGKEAGRLLDEAMLSYDPDKQVYVFKAYTTESGTEDSLVEFEGKPKTENNIVFDRVRKDAAKTDGLDRLDLKVINDGDRVVYTFHRQVGKGTFYKPYSMVALDRQGVSFAGASQQPKCIVSGGLGVMTVSYMGKSYPVCCTGCQAMFNEDPERWLAKLAKK